MHEVLCLCFGLGPTPWIFAKLLKVPISVFRRLVIRIIIYLDASLILGISMTEFFMERDSLIFLLQHLGFIINLKKCDRSCTRNRVISIDCWFPNYEFVITSGKDREDKKSRSDVMQGISVIASGFENTNRNTFFNHSSSVPSPSTVFLLAATANCISKTNTLLPHFGKADCHGKKWFVMLGQQPGTFQWLIGYTTTGRVPYSDRCIQKRLGLYVKGTEQGIKGPRRNRVYISISWNF